MKASVILSSLYVGGFMPMACFVRSGRSLIEDINRSPFVYELISGCLEPSKNYFLIKESVQNAFPARRDHEAAFVYSFACDTYFAYEIDE